MLQRFLYHNGVPSVDPENSLVSTFHTPARDTAAKPHHIPVSMWYLIALRRQR